MLLREQAVNWIRYTLEYTTHRTQNTRPILYATGYTTLLDIAKYNDNDNSNNNNNLTKQLFNTDIVKCIKFLC